MRGRVGELLAGQLGQRATERHAEPVRAFLALPVLPPALGHFQVLRERLMAEVDAVRWAPADSPHITLHFFGALNDAAALSALDALVPELAERTPMTLQLRGLGGFPSSGRPRVLWCGVDGDLDALATLARGCAAALLGTGLSVDDRPHRPHCTLGRPRQPWPGHARGRWLDLAAEGPTGPRFTADRAILYESVNGSEGVTHIPRSTLPLGAGR
ncbi:MAG: RNA 2',3'-cyclic phosphodiesterase [Candidatus Dormibacteria bacterium]